MITYLKPFIVGFLGACAAALVIYGGYTAYQDHLYVRALVNMVQQQQARPAQPPPVQ